MWPQERDYRRLVGGNLQYAIVSYRETDLAIGLLPGVWSDAVHREVLLLVRRLWRDLEEYLALNPSFAASHAPYKPLPDAPEIAVTLAAAGKTAGVGPMAAVAGYFAWRVGGDLLRFSSQVVVENGGDIYLAGNEERVVGVFAGDWSPFSHQVGLRITPSMLPLGVCTSSGTIGPSFSYGVADAVVVLAPDVALADAAATATANFVQSKQDLSRAVRFASTIPGVIGALAVKDDQLAAWGQIELVNIAK